MPLAGTQWLPRRIASLAHDAGWRDEKLITAVAICLAESDGYDGAYHDNPDGSRDRGVWQINSVAHSEVSDECAYDPKCATVEAYRIYKGRSYTFSAWAAYTNGAYERQLDHATRGVMNYWREKYGLGII